MQTGYRNSKTVRKRRIRIVMLCIPLLVAGLISMGFWYWNMNKDLIIETGIQKAIEKTKDAFYRVSYTDLQVDEASGSLLVSNMKLTYDSSKYLLRQQQGKMPSILFSITVPQIKVVGVKTARAMIDKEIIGRKVEIRDPIIDLQYTYRGKDSVRNVPTREIYREILDNLDLVQIDSVVITGARVRTSNKNTGKVLIDVKDIDLSLLDLRVDSMSVKDSARFLFSRQMNLNVAQILWPSPNKLYDYKIQNISLRSSNRDLSVSQVTVKPRLGENEFVNAIPTQDDRYDFAFSNIVFSGIDIDRLFNEYFEAQTMTIGNSSLRVYRDLARPRDNKSRVGHYPHQVMDDIPVRFNIKKVNIRNSFVEYKERSHITRQSGKVRFHDVSGSLTNFTNDKKRGSKVMKVYLNSIFLNKTRLKTEWTFYLLDPNGKFDVSGKVDAIDGQDLNVLAEPMGPATIKEGRLNGLTFQLKGDNYAMQGNVKMLYHDLKVAILEKDKGETKLDKKFLTSLLANFAIKNSNPKEGDEVRIEQVHHTRNTNRSFFNLCWKTIFKGIRQTLGIKQEMAAS